MSDFNFEDFDADAGERQESASFEEIAQNQPDLLGALRADAEGLCLQSAIIYSGVRRLAARTLNHVTPTIRVVAPDDAALLVSLLQNLERAALNVNAVARAILSNTEEVVMAEPPKEEEPLSEETKELRSRFFTAARKMGLKMTRAARDERIEAISEFLGREIAATDELDEEEWISIIYAIEDGRLEW